MDGFLTARSVHYAAHRHAVRAYQAHQRETDSSRLTMGRGSYGEPAVIGYPGEGTRVRIGAFVSIASHVTLGDGGHHRSEWATTAPLRVLYDLPGAMQDGQPWSKGDVIIGNDVWIGWGAHILCGVTVGDGAVIGADSVVTGDVRPYAIAAGNPAREIRRRFDDAQIEALLEIAWWSWPDEKITAHVDELCHADIDRFIAGHRPAAP